MNDYKFHKKFLCFILLIVKFGLPCHAQSSIIAEKILLICQLIRYLPDICIVRM